MTSPIVTSTEIARRQTAAAPQTPGGRSLHVVCHSFFDAWGRDRNIGGVETYVQLLANLAAARGWRAFVYQTGKVRSFLELPDGITVLISPSLEESAARLAANRRQNDGIVVYSDYHSTPRVLEHPSIFLQHGVGWDYVATRLKNPLLQRLNHWRKRFKRLRLLSRIRTICREADSIVCVDTNFANFMQATFPFDYPRIAGKMNYVPNCGSILPRDRAERKWSREEPRLRCIFPRRYAEIRGAVLFAEVVRDLAPLLPEVDFGFIGDGECEGRMRAILQGCPRVSFYRRDYSEMPEEYFRADVAVIPTLASEGTSLSCIEAMSAGCAVVATTVGGLPNLVIPGFSGILSKATQAALREQLLRLLADRSEIRRLGRNAYEMARASFSVELWEQRFGQVLSDLTGGEKR